MENKNDNNQIRTIVTNAVYGKTIKKCRTTIYLDSKEDKGPSQVLGCTIKGAEINECIIHEFKENKIIVKANGIFEVHVWYEINGDTHIAKNSILVSELVQVKSLGGELNCNNTVCGKILNCPKTLGTMIINKSGTPTISIEVEYEILVEVTGEAKLNVLTYRPKFEKEEKNDFDQLKQEDENDDD